MDDRFAMPSDDAINKWTLEASGVQSNGTSPAADPNGEEAQTWGYVTRPKLVQFGVRGSASPSPPPHLCIAYYIFEIIYLYLEYFYLYHMNHNHIFFLYIYT